MSFPKEELGFASVIIQHNYFFNQDRVGPLEYSRCLSPFAIGLSDAMGYQMASGAVFWCRNALNESYINHMSSLKSLGLMSRKSFISISNGILRKK